MAAARTAEAFGGKVFRTSDLLELFANTGIRTRRTVRPMDWYVAPRPWPERNAVYAEAADALFMEAAQAALAKAGLSPGEVAAVVTVSSTGVATPSLEARVLPRMGFSNTVRRTPVFGLGCGGGVAGLSIAARLAEAEPGRPVLLVVVELCSLSCRPDEATKANVVATALFGDGAAAAVLIADASARGRVVERSGEHTWPDTLDIMGWRVDEGGLGVVLASSLPAFVTREMGQAAHGYLAGAPGTEVARFVCHPGGAKVLTALETVLDLPDGALDQERAVLSDFGNMSAPTVFFVLDRVLSAGETGRLVMASLGPGFSAHFLTLGPADAP